jgi:hypothetical protein
MMTDRVTRTLIHPRQAAALRAAQDRRNSGAEQREPWTCAEILLRPLI